MVPFLSRMPVEFYDLPFDMLEMTTNWRNATPP